MKRPPCPWPAPHEEMNRARARQLIDDVRQKGRTILTEYESKQIFAAYGIPTVETRLAATPDDAVREAAVDRLPGRAQAQLRDHHAQDRRQGRAAQPQGRAGCARGL